MSDAAPSLAIHVRNRQRALQIDLPRLRAFSVQALGKVRAVHGMKASVLETLDDIFVVLVSDRKIARLHRQFMRITGPTDVITFQNGEIFISVETAARHAAEFREEWPREIERYVVHGLLHLHGFDDRHAAAAQRMQTRQEEVLRQCAATKP